MAASSGLRLPSRWPGPCVCRPPALLPSSRHVLCLSALLNLPGCVLSRSLAVSVSSPLHCSSSLQPHPAGPSHAGMQASPLRKKQTLKAKAKPSVVGCARPSPVPGQEASRPPILRPRLEKGSALPEAHQYQGVFPSGPELSCLAATPADWGLLLGPPPLGPP